MNKKDIKELFRRFEEALPEPTTELEFTNPYTLLVAVVLAAQSTDRGVNIATRPLFKIADTPQKMLNLGLDALKEYVKTIGLYNNKAKNVIALSKILVDSYEGQVPNTRDALEKLPGVGRKTANVILNTVFGQPTLAVDTHVFRVSHRLGLSQGKTPEAVEEDLLKIVPIEYLSNAHHWLVLHGRYICKAKVPRCVDCLIRNLCPYSDKTLPR